MAAGDTGMGEMTGSGRDAPATAHGPLLYDGAEWNFDLVKKTYDAIHEIGVGEAVIASAIARGVPIVSSRQMLDWLDASKRLRFARQLFNEAAGPYDEAIAAFPTRLLVSAFRFEPAGRL